MADARKSGSTGPEGFEPITEDYTWQGNNEGLAMVEYNAQEEMERLLMGRRVTKVNDDHLLLDDGTVLRVIPNDGGCSCGAGDYELTALNGVDNIITKVEFDYQPTDDSKPYTDPNGFYRIFVLAGDERINLFTVEGDDGNGYYGTGFHIMVRRAKEGADA